MQIREATEVDIPGILKVLRASLGEISSKKTEEVWRYKHINNPFGKSLILIAEENEEVIGVRAFMRWQWQKGEKVFSAFRAVDTATHPSHQGKGIFKKLTLKALKVGKERGDHFVFNTPNTQSKPGYLKMGWKEIDKIEVTLYPTFNFFSSLDHYAHMIESDLEFATLNSYNLQRKNSLKFFTPKTLEFLNWRYKKCVLQKYIIYEDKDGFMAGYVKTRGKLRELRISEVIYSNPLKKKFLKEMAKKWSKEYGCPLISTASKTFFSNFTGKFGPSLTYKAINLIKKEDSQANSLENWNYSLGDLELF